MKKGDMSMGVIIGAAIALLILVIISVLLFDAFGQIREGTSCNGIDGAQCVLSDESCSDLNDGSITYTSSSNSCSTDEEKCCIPLG